MGVIPSSQACVCTVAAFLTTCPGCTGNEPCAIHVPLTQKGDLLCKRNVLHLKDRKTGACQAVAQMWPVGFGAQDGQRELMLEVTHGRIELLFSFMTFLPQSIIERIHG